MEQDQHVTLIKPNNALGRSHRNIALETAPPLFDAAQQRLSTRCLIEASAGTGKSFTLVVLYLRFLLGLETELPPQHADQIVVITFTVAAARELQQRLARALKELIEALGSETMPRGKEAQIIFARTTAEQRPLFLRHLLQVQKNFSKAIITTIHGFCKKILHDWAFQTAAPSFCGGIGSHSKIFQHHCSEWWTTQLRDPVLAWREALLECLPTVESLSREASRFCDRETLMIHQACSRAECLKRLQQRQETFEKFQRMFHACSPEEWVDQFQRTPRLMARKGIRDWSSWINKIGLSLKIFTPYHSKILSTELKRLVNSHLCPSAETPQVKSLSEMAALTLDHLEFDSAPSLLSEFYHYYQSEAIRKRWKRREIIFQDLIEQIHAALQDPRVAEKIAASYSIFMIDECQDVDAKQHGIIEKMSPGTQKPLKKPSLIFVGDPKQSIYAFRGADIFTYFTLRRSMPECYPLLINYRATHSMLEAVQSLWSTHPQPFVFEHLQFERNLPASIAPHQWVRRQEKILPAIEFHACDPHKKAVCFSQVEYRSWISEICAKQISMLLKEGEICTDGAEKNPITKKISTKDVVILVQNWIEAEAIQHALHRHGLKGFYSSDSTPLFLHQGAQWLYDIFLALRDEPFGPARSSLVAAARACAHEGEDAGSLLSLEAFNEICQRALIIWQSEGILPAVLHLLPHTLLAGKQATAPENSENLRAFHQALQHVIVEDQRWGCQQAERTLAWFKKEIQAAENQKESIRLVQEQPENTILIVSVFKAKGLEFPIVWGPFASTIVRKSEGFFHDKDSFQLLWSKSKEEPVVTAQMEEQFSEQMRLFYVTTTRAVLHLALGAAPVCGLARKKQGTDSHRSPLGYLLQEGREQSGEDFYATLTRFVGQQRHFGIHWHQRRIEPGLIVRPVSAAKKEGRVSICPYHSDLSLKINSYSQMSRGASSASESMHAFENWFEETAPSFCKEEETEEQEPALAEDNPIWQEWVCSDPRPFVDPGDEHFQQICKNFDPNWTFDLNFLPHAITAFPKGSQAGSCLHAILEAWDPRSAPPLALIQASLRDYCIHSSWAIWVREWMQNLVQMPLLSDGMRLVDLDRADRVPEMKFMMHIPRRVSGESLERSFPKIVEPNAGTVRSLLTFPPFHGGIQGFLDLVFRWQGKYYVLDYKSNWLGYRAGDYDRTALFQAILQHRYDLQYAIYTVALDEYLRSIQTDYCYEAHFGGVIYLFLRGVAWFSDLLIPGGKGLGQFIHKIDPRDLQKIKEALGK